MAGLLGTIGAFSNPYGTPSHDEWALNSAKFKLLDGSATELLFFASKVSEDDPGSLTALESMSDTGGRRLAIYEYPYRDGQVIEDLGRRGERYVFNLTFFGPNYRERYADFYRKVIQTRAAGVLTHPTIGDVTARLLEYDFIHSHDQFSAVKLRCTFIEDSTTNTRDNPPAIDKVGAIDSVLRGALSVMTTVNRVVGNSIFEVSALLLLPGSIQTAMRQRLGAIITAHSRLLGQLAATFGTDGSIINLGSSSGGISGANSGVSASTGQTLPPVFQVGLSPDEQAAVSDNEAAFKQANQITATQLVFNVNQARAQVAETIAYHESQTGSDAFDVVISYRQLVVSFQKAAEAAIKSASLQTVQYLVPFDMTLTEAAFANKLDPDRMIDIERLNPGLGSANFVPRGTILTVPAA